VLALVFFSTLIVTLTVTRIYEASAVIEVSQETPNVTTFQEVLGSEVQAREFYETQVELLGSKAMINRVIENLDLIDHPVIRKTVFNDGDTGIGQRIVQPLLKKLGKIWRDQTKSEVGMEVAQRQQVVTYIEDNLIGHPKPQVHVDRCLLSFSGPSFVPVGGQYPRGGLYRLENGAAC
jgi:uncharacterized protein involved in exopolysaccharide biosynthesis